MPALHDPPDGGCRAWTIVFASFMVSFLQDGLAYSFGVLVPLLATHYQVGRAETSVTMSIMTFLNFVTGLIGGFLVKRIGYRFTNLLGAFFTIAGLIASGLVIDHTPAEPSSIVALYATLGGMVGFGFGLMYFPAMEIVPLYFSRRLGIANGVATAGSGAGQMVLAPGLQVLTSSLGLGQAFYVMAAVVAPAALFGCLYKKPNQKTDEAEMESPEEENLTANQENDTSPADGSHNTYLPSVTKSLFILLPHYFLMNAAIFSTVKFTYDRAVHRGLSPHSSGWLLSIMGVANCVGRIGFGLVLDRFRSKLILVCTAVMVVNSLSIILSEHLTSFQTLAVFCAIFGATFGAHVCSAVVMLQSYMDRNLRVTDSLALTFVTVGLSTIVGPLVVGGFFDATGSYTLGFQVIGMYCFSYSSLSLRRWPVTCWGPPAPGFPVERASVENPDWLVWLACQSRPECWTSHVR